MFGAVGLFFPSLAEAQQAHHFFTPDPATSDTANNVQHQTALLVSSNIANRFSPLFNAFSVAGAPAQTEIAPAAWLTSDSLAGLSIWGSGSNSWQRNKQTAVRSKGTSQTFTFGADYAFNEKISSGLSINYTHSDIDTLFNNGYTRSNAGSIVPYVNFTFTDWLSADISAGYSFGRTRQRRVVAGVASSGSYNNHGWLLSANLNAARWFDSWMLAAKTGIFINRDRQAGFTESNGTVHPAANSHLTQWSIGGSVSYYAAPFLPYVSLTYKYDVARDKAATPGVSNDRDEIELGTGFNVYGSNEWKNLTAGFSLTTIVGRKYKRNTTAAFNLRYTF